MTADDLGDATRPPMRAIDIATRVAAQSPCAKSKRGAFAYFIADSGHVVALAAGYNSHPMLRQCDGSKDCRATCRYKCVHAEQRAITVALGILPVMRQHGPWAHVDSADVSLIHVKVVDGKYVAGGPPSCWQCSKLLLDVGFGGIWLYEDLQDCWAWRYYTAGEFHRVTWQNQPKDGPR